MVETVTFRARARTIDHLGREQIADCPTAVSELWKNAYDAYARRVALHLFDGQVPSAAVVDDGHGMSRRELVDRWFTIGTESKAGTGADVPEADRNLLPVRPRQGQKGIGRLSVAFLGPVCLVISKRRGSPFCAALIDWRIFQNPYLHLDDIGVPVHEFDDPSGFQSAFSEMVDALVANVWGKSDPARRKRIEDAWSRYDSEDPLLAKHGTSASIVQSALTAALPDDHLATWSTWTGESDHGTALFVFGVSDELAAWLPSKRRDDPEQEASRDLLRSTLTDFVDPYTTDAPQFEYSVVLHTKGNQRALLSNTDVFGHSDLHSLEHVVEGEFGIDGTFRGRVTAFGRNLGTFTHKPARPVPNSGSGVVGAFQFCIGTFEQDVSKTSHTGERHAKLRELADKFGGLSMYRDFLRVMPYGRPDADYFGMEERRSQHAGREFWAHRRSFGRVALTRSDNPNLRDKAGREGLIDNRARRELRALVIDLLKQSARKYFGTGSGVREEMLPEMQRRKAREEDARAVEEAARKAHLRLFRESLKQQAPTLGQARLRLETTLEGLTKAVQTKDAKAIAKIGGQVDEAQELQSKLRLPLKPRRLGQLEEAYRNYRDDYSRFTDLLKECLETLSNASERLHLATPAEQIEAAAEKHRAFCHSAAVRWQHDLNTALQKVGGSLRARMDEELAAFDRGTSSLLSESRTGKRTLADTLKALLALRDESHSDLALRNAARVRALESLAGDADVEEALLWSAEERAELKREVEQIHALAQLGITVEIVSHEFNDLDSEVRHNLDRLPASVRSLIAFKNANRAYTSLVDRLKFLSPVKLAGPRLAEKISGDRIATYVSHFFSTQFSAKGIALEVTDAFRELQVVEYPSRLLPVFLNLVNNAVHWLGHAEGERHILLDAVDGNAVIADSGPGVDPDDIANLFTLFFTRRVEGRGVGLYLCRLNLAAGGHRIEYSTDPRYHRLPGAHFVIHFLRPDNA